jgi:ribose 5-phosphate isomerase A
VDGRRGRGVAAAEDGVTSGISSDERAARKRAAAERAVAWVRSGMVVGLGAGSTVMFAVARLGELLARGALDDVRCVPCSGEVAEASARHGITLTTLESHPMLDLTIDGADEVDRAMCLIKGGGGALLREKIVAQASRREIIVVDDAKLSPVLGMRAVLPVEVLPFGWRTQQRFLETLGARVQLRRSSSGAPFRTEQDNHILDCELGPIWRPHALARLLAERAGIVAHGLFLDLATDLVIAGEDGVVHETRGART